MKPFYRNWLWVIPGMIFSIISLPAYAQQNIKVEILSTDDGLSQGMVYDILQDTEGFLWIGTKDGLNRYDGYQFEVFTNDPDDPWSISGNTVTLIFEDSKGRIWAATDNSGVDIYDKLTGKFYHIQHDPAHPGGLSGDHIVSIIEDSSGYFLLNVDEEEINMLKLEDDFFEKQQPPHVIRIPVPVQDIGSQAPGTILRGITRDTKGRIWVGGPGVLYRLDVQKAQLTIAREGYSIGTTIPNDDGSFWGCGHHQPLFHWDGDHATLIPGEFRAVNQFARDDRDQIWAMRADSLLGLDLRNILKHQPISSVWQNVFYQWAPDIPSTDYPLSSLEIDRSGIIWVGTNGYGLYQINPNQTRFTHKLPGISVRNIAVVSEKKHFLWTYTGWFNEDHSFLDLNPLSSDDALENVDYMIISRSGDYWAKYIGITENKYVLIKHSPGTGMEKYLDIPWLHYDSQPMMESADGLIWLTGFNQLLTVVNPATQSVFTFDLKDGRKTEIDNQSQKLISKEYSTAIYEDKAGVLWVGTENGMVRCRRNGNLQNNLDVTHYKNIPGNQRSLSYNHVMCFLDDPDNPERYLWVCTKGGGINRLDKTDGTFLRLTKADGLPDNVVYGLLPDERGNLWGSTNKGIFCLLQDSLRADKYSFRNFSQKDGLQAEEFNTGAYAKLPGGKLIFGGVNGYNVFDPKEILSVDFHPPVYITKILVNNQPVRPRDEFNILKKSTAFTKEITLSPRHDILTLEFSSLDYTAPDRNRYRYQLVGIDDAWIEAENHRSATFLHLPPREYIFRVQGSNSQGIWSDHIAELIINVLPPWYRTWWAYLLYVTVLAMAIATYIRFSINRAKLQQQLGFEKQETDRVRELDALKTRLFVNMTHEFRTPLTIIIGMAQQVMDDPRAHFSGGMKMILSNGQNLLGMVNRMLNLSKLESGKMTLELVQGDMVLFLRNIVESFRSFAAKKKIQLHFLPEVDVVMMDFDPDKIQQVISNLISNAFKFTPEDGHIYFLIRRENGSLRIRVKDTGCGIEEKDQDKIFDRFYQTDSSSTRRYEGTGIGLALCKNLVTLMEGQISVQSPPVGTRRGSEFTVILPIRQEVLIAGAAQHQYLEPFKNTPLENGTKASTTNMEAVQSATPGIEKQAVPFENIEDPLILLVEDNADVVAYIASCLGDYQLVVAENGQEGFEMATELIPDLIISDVMMPVMDGFELCQKLKTDERTDHIPVMILSARADMDSKMEGLELGANAYLPKPFDKQELLLNIRNLFELRSKLRRHYQNLAGLADSTETKVDIPNTSTSEDEFVIKVREMIEANINDFNFTVEQLASELHLSHSQFGRKLDALTGFTPNRFIRNIRLRKAKELLLNQELSITAVAYDCGFNDPSYFTRIFKKEFGKTPLEWRSQEVSS
jgi:signal transduction histidine kinase/CheY-like chemotaxis protein/AraC-like DNA-binding protein/ligand-binding sensor domain-containing protein